MGYSALQGMSVPAANPLSDRVGIADHQKESSAWKLPGEQVATKHVGRRFFEKDVVSVVRKVFVLGPLAMPDALDGVPIVVSGVLKEVRFLGPDSRHTRAVGRRHGVLFRIKTVGVLKKRLSFVGKANHPLATRESPREHTRPGIVHTVDEQIAAVSQRASRIQG